MAMTLINKDDIPADSRWSALRDEVQSLQRTYQAAYERPESERRKAIAAGYVDAFVMVLGRMEALERA
jgi:hypothetical protein